jgi:hypothetical protein
MTMLLALALLTPDPGVYQSATPDAPTQGASRRTPNNPNETICRREREPGTRVVIRRTCMTRQEWADYRRELRQNVDRAQMTRVHAAH